MYGTSHREQVATTIEPAEKNQLGFELAYNTSKNKIWGVYITLNGKRWGTITYLGDNIDNAEGVAIDSWTECQGVYAAGQQIQTKHKPVSLDILFEELK